MYNEQMCLCIDLCKLYYSFHPAGGSLHIVLDDGNISYDDLEFCAAFANTEKDYFGYALSKELQKLTIIQIEEIYSRCHELYM